MVIITNLHFLIFSNLFFFNLCSKGNTLSEIYTGTSALRSQFVLNGSITIFNKLYNLTKSIRRYWINNLFDGTRQDAYDIFLKHNETIDGWELNFQRKSSRMRKVLFITKVLLTIIAGK